MNSKIYYKKGILFAVVLLCVVDLKAAPKFSYSYLDEAIKGFESKNSISSVVLMEMDSGKVEYIYRPEVAISKKLPPGSLVKTFSALTLLKYKDKLGFSPEKKVTCKGRFYPEENFSPTKSDLNTLHLPRDEKWKRILKMFYSERSRRNGSQIRFSSVLQCIFFDQCFLRPGSVLFKIV